MLDIPHHISGVVKATETKSVPGSTARQIVGGSATFRTSFQIPAFDATLLTSLSSIYHAVGTLRAHSALGYAIAFALTAAATGLQWAGRDLYQGTPFLTIYPAVVLTAFVGGYRAGLLSAFLAGLTQWGLFIPQYSWLGVLSYAIDATLCVVLIEYVNRSLKREIEAKEHQALLKNELHHRVRNLFAVTQSIINFSLPDRDDALISPAAMKRRLFGRLKSTLDAHQYIIDATGVVILSDLIRRQIHGLENQFELQGQTRLVLSSQLTQNFSLILFELITNSLKYGALSTARGSVKIRVKDVVDGTVFGWTEFGGPAVGATLQTVGADGFGSRILGQFAHSFCSDVTLTCETPGLSYSLRIPRPVGN